MRFRVAMSAVSSFCGPLHSDLVLAVTCSPWLHFWLLLSLTVTPRSGSRGVTRCSLAVLTHKIISSHPVQMFATPTVEFAWTPSVVGGVRPRSRLHILLPWDEESATGQGPAGKRYLLPCLRVLTLCVCCVCRHCVCADTVCASVPSPCIASRQAGRPTCCSAQLVAAHMSLLTVREIYCFSLVSHA